MFNGINGMLFQQSLQDLVKGIRAHRRDEEEFIRTKLTEIAEECRSSDVSKKTNAVLKLTHLQMMGYSIAFASFHVVEVMSNPDFASKRIGYLAAAQSFSPATDVLLLTTNQFKKDLTNGKLQDCSQALTCLGKIITEELGRDLEKDVSLLLTSPRPYIRKKALLVLFRLIMVHPDTLPIVSGRFRERLTDSDPGVVCAAVTVTTELARTSPSTFLSLAPLLYQLLMNKDSNNWMLIKIVKLMGVLTPLEPRLGKKLVEPLTSLMRTTRAKSLLYECCSTVTAGLLNHPEAVELCAQRLSEFMNDTDQNLKYLGLLCMRKVIQAHPNLAGDHRDNILDCLDDEDIGIRMRALELVSEFITKRNLRDISRILLRKLRKASAEGFIVDDALSGESVDSNPGSSRPSFSASIDQEAPFREALARELSSAGEYKRATGTFKGGYGMLSTADDFAWYLTTILGGLSEIPLLSNSVRKLVSDQLLELTSRVEALRPVSVRIAFSLISMRVGKGGDQNASAGLSSNSLDVGGDADVGSGKGGSDKASRVPESGTADAILSSTLAGTTSWILGEYAELIDDFIGVTRRLVGFPKRGLDSAAQVRVMTACVKVYVASPDDAAPSVFSLVSEYVGTLVSSQFAEVQDRAWFFNSLLSEFEPSRRGELSSLFSGKLIPVDPRAQSKVPVSKELDLDTPLLNLGSESLYAYLKKSVGDDEDEVDDDGAEDDGDLFKTAIFSNVALSMNPRTQPTGESKQAEASILPSIGETVEKREASPFYLNGSSSGNGRGQVGGSGMDDSRFDRGNYGYDGGRMATEAAVVIAEENPLGLSLSDDDGKEYQKTKLESRLQDAFDASFQTSEEIRRPAPGKKEKKKKKKKKKDGKKAVEVARKEEASLIDFGEDGATQDGVGGPSQPKHVADTLLM